MLPPEDGVLFIEVIIRLLHSSNSTGPAYLVTLRHQLSDILMLVSYSFNTSSDFNAESTSNLSSSQLAFNMEVLPLGDVLTIRYLAQVDPDKEGNISDEVFVSYGTIRQDGIGVEVS